MTICALYAKNPCGWVKSRKLVCRWLINISPPVSANMNIISLQHARNPQISIGGSSWRQCLRLNVNQASRWWTWTLIDPHRCLQNVPIVVCQIQKTMLGQVSSFRCTKSNCWKKKLLRKPSTRSNDSELFFQCSSLHCKTKTLVSCQLPPLPRQQYGYLKWV